MKKNGFTLIELMAVIIILALLSMIIVPIVENSINSGKDELYISQIDSIKVSLKKYAVDKINSNIRNVGDDIYVSLYQLKTAGYVNLDIADPRSEKLIPNDMILHIEKREKSYIYEVLETTGTKTNETKYNKNTPIIEAKEIVYYCNVISEGSAVPEDFNNILNNYTITSGTVTKEYYDTYFDEKHSLSELLSKNEDFRVVYKSSNAYFVTNVLRNGCD